MFVKKSRIHSTTLTHQATVKREKEVEGRKAHHKLNDELVRRVIPTVLNVVDRAVCFFTCQCASSYLRQSLRPMDMAVTCRERLEAIKIVQTTKKIRWK